MWLAIHFIELYLDPSKSITEQKIAHLFRLRIQFFPLEGHFSYLMLNMIKELYNHKEQTTYT